MLSGESTQNVKENVAELKAIGDKSKKYPHLYWSCERSMYRGFVLDRKHYEATYIEQLSKKHEATAWKMIKSGARSYGKLDDIIQFGLLSTALDFVST